MTEKTENILISEIKELREAVRDLSVNTVHNWIRAHKITVYNYGGKIMIERKKLNDFIEKSKVESIPDLVQAAIKNKK